MVNVALSLGAMRGSAAATCPSACTQQLAECKRTCPGGGQERRDCRAACAERSTCTAPGARIRTLAYVVSECTDDPQGRWSLKQKLLVRRGNCDPVAVMEAATQAPTPGTGNCRVWGGTRNGAFSIFGGAFQRLAVLPDGSAVVFEMTTQFSVFPSLSPALPRGEGMFLVRADGSGLRRLGPASRVPSFAVLNDVYSPLGISFPLTGIVYSVSPNGRSIALIDLGPDTAGHEAPQIFLLDLRSGRRTQLTHLSRVAAGGDLRLPSFLDSRTIGFYSGYSAASGSNEPLKAYLVKTDGTGLHEEIPTAPTAGPGARVLPQFGVTGARQQILLVTSPDKRPVNPAFGNGVTELFLRNGKNLLQLTDFGRGDTGVALSSFISRGRVFFLASANPPPGENPTGVCQVFSIDTFGGDLRQVTHLPSDGRPPNTGCFNGGPAVCTIDRDLGVVPDKVTGTMLFASSCDPVGGNPFGDQIFAIGRDGSGLRQLTATRGMTIDPDGTVHGEFPGPFAYAREGQG